MQQSIFVYFSNLACAISHFAWLYSYYLFQTSLVPHAILHGFTHVISLKPRLCHEPFCMTLLMLFLLNLACVRSYFAWLYSCYLLQTSLVSEAILHGFTHVIFYKPRLCQKLFCVALLMLSFTNLACVRSYFAWLYSCYLLQTSLVSEAILHGFTHVIFFKPRLCHKPFCMALLMLSFSNLACAISLFAWFYSCRYFQTSPDPWPLCMALLVLSDVFLETG